MKNYYLLTSKKKKKVLVTRNYEECFEFMAKAPDTRIRTIDYTGKPRILNRIAFFKSFIRNTEDIHSLFILIEAMVTGENNKNDLILALKLRQEHNTWKIENLNSL